MVITITKLTDKRKGFSVLDTLMDCIDGAYRVSTTASTYVIDLDRMGIRREPRTVDLDAALLRRDAELVTLRALAECTVGRPMVLQLDLHVVGVLFTTRTTTVVMSIERIPSPGTEFSA